MPAEMGGQHGGSVGTDTEKAGMPQADLAGKTDQQVQAEHNHRIDRHADHQIHIKTVGQHERQHQRGWP
jgi:hypothetical protein